MLHTKPVSILLFALVASACAGKNVQTHIDTVGTDVRNDPPVTTTMEYNDDIEHEADYTGVFHHSDIALMPEWEPDNIAAMKPLRPTVVAWGNDSIFNTFDQLKSKTGAYESIGVRLQATNVWLLTATEKFLHENPAYRNAVCRDVAGDPIVPPWLSDAKYRGTPAYWGCTNNPLYQEHIIDRLTKGVRAGADMLHVDDHLGTAAAADFAGGCFCEYCMNKFRQWLVDNYNTRELKDLGIDNPATFNYKDHLQSRGITTKADYLVRQKSLVLNDAFLAFHFDAATGWVGTMKSKAADVAGKPMILGINAYNLDPSHMSNTHQAEYFANEVEHYDREDEIAPFVYLQGTALHKAIFATATGHDWIQVKKNNDVTRVQWWIAQSYAFGHYFMYAYKKWGYSEETGTVWYDTPMDTFIPVFSFVAKNRNLFDGYTPVTNIGLLYGNNMGRLNIWESREIAIKLLDAGAQFSLIVGGDGFLKMSITDAHKDGFDTIIQPSVLALDDKQAAVLEQWKKDDLVTDWDGTVPAESWVITTSADKLWALARMHRSKRSIVIHLLNRDFDATEDRMNLKKNVEVKIPTAMLNGLTGVTLHAPGEDPQTLSATEADGTLTVTVPGVNIWAVLHLQ